LHRPDPDEFICREQTLKTEEGSPLPVLLTDGHEVDRQAWMDYNQYTQAQKEAEAQSDGNWYCAGVTSTYIDQAS
jgi:hypothetical protein